MSRAAMTTFNRAALSVVIVATAAGLSPWSGAATTSFPRGRILVMGGQTPVDLPIQFTGMPVTDHAFCVSVDVQTGMTPNTQELQQLVLHFSPEGAMEVVARQGQAVPGAPGATYMRFNNIINATVGDVGVPFFRFTTAGSSGIARFSGGMVDPLLGTGAPSNGAIEPGAFVSAENKLLVAAGDSLVTVVPTTKMVTEVIKAGDMLGGRTVTGISSTTLFPLTIAPDGAFATAVLTVDGGADALTLFDLQGQDATIALVEGGPMPGFPAGVTIRFLLSSADVNARGDWSVQTRLIGTGITDANDFVL